jgi:hypothetical protein
MAEAWSKTALSPCGLDPHRMMIAEGQRFPGLAKAIRAPAPMHNMTWPNLLASVLAVFSFWAASAISSLAKRICRTDTAQPFDCVKIGNKATAFPRQYRWSLYLLSQDHQTQ